VELVKTKEKKKGPAATKRQAVHRPYSPQYRLKAVRLHVEDGIPGPLVAKEMGIDQQSLYNWVKKYKERGEAGLVDGQRGPGGPKLPIAVREKIVALKRAEPMRGVRRISDLLRRCFLLKASPGSVRRELKRSKIVLPPPPKARKPPKPVMRRFESAAPNGMWQSDITVYPVIGHNAYVIGFIDDHSRYITGMGLYRSQTADNVLELYRQAVGQYGTPKEMLTDNGRQYANWRGVTKFQAELRRDHVHHIRSAAHHPMTLGKIERFWKTLKEEFLSRARFDTFEEARERLAYWVKYYNHRRPHQSLDGGAPADRYFTIQTELRSAIERGIDANVEELALRGKPSEPFYMVGRVGDKAVVIEADKRGLSVRVDGEEVKCGRTGKDGTEYENGNGSGAENGKKPDDEAVRGEGEEPGGAGPVERAAQRLGPVEGAGGALGRDPLLGEPGIGGDARGARPELEPADPQALRPARAAGETAGADDQAGGGAGNPSNVKESGHDNDGRAESGTVRGAGEMPGGAGDVERAEEGGGSMPGTGDQPGAALAVAGSGALGYAGGVGAQGGTGGLGDGTGAGAAGAAAVGAQSAGTGRPEPGARPAAAAEGEREEGRGAGGGGLRGEADDDAGGRSGRGTAPGDPGADGRTADVGRGGGAAGGEPQDVLRVAGEGAAGHGGGLAGRGSGAAAEPRGSGERAAEGAGERVAAGECAPALPVANPK
jgi:transposase InsO family protein